MSCVLVSKSNLILVSNNYILIAQTLWIMVKHNKFKFVYDFVKRNKKLVEA
jgi:hypothetical protein